MIEEFTPRQIVAELDRFIIGQTRAKRAVAVALRNRYRRSLLAEDLRDEVIPKNILMIGPTGVGKTEIARRLAQLARAPFLKVEATKFTEVGYVGRDVDSILRDLVQVSLRLVEAERTEAVRPQAETIAVDRIVDLLVPRRGRGAPSAGRSAEPMTELQRQMAQLFGVTPPSTPAEEETDRRDDRVRENLRQQVRDGLRDGEMVEIEVEEAAPTPMLPMLGGPGGEAGGGDLAEMLGQMLPRRKKQRRMPIREARKVFAAEAARGLLDREDLTRDAIERVEQGGIIFLDEIDKIAGRGREHAGPDVSREGVQRDLLPIIEGSTVQTKWGPVRTNHILFIAAGAFHVSKPSDLIPELQGRLPIRVELESLNEADFRRILTEPANALTRQYAALLATEGVTITFVESGIRELARIAVEVNARTENVGARRLHTVMERLLEEISFAAPELEKPEVVIDDEFVRDRLADIAKNDELARYIL